MQQKIQRRNGTGSPRAAPPPESPRIDIKKDKKQKDRVGMMLSLVAARPLYYSELKKKVRGDYRENGFLLSEMIAAGTVEVESRMVPLLTRTGRWIVRQTFLINGANEE